MSYVSPTRWAEGDYPLATDLNTLSDDLDFIHDLVGDYSTETPTFYEYGPGQAFYFFSMYRYLNYNSTGVIHDPTEVEEDITLSDPSSGIGVYDLSTTTWIVPGRQYEVVGCQWCEEVLANDG